MAEIFIAKIDPAGHFVWALSAGGSSFDSGTDVALDQWGNVYATGYFTQTSDFGNISLTGGANEAYLAKLSPGGQFLWAIQAGGTSDDVGEGVALDSNGNPYLIGTFEGTASFGPASRTTNGGDDVFVAKYDSAGQFQWVNTFGGSTLDFGYGISSSPVGAIYVTGSFQNVVDFGGTNLTSVGNADVFVVKLSGNGQVLWAKRAGSITEDTGQGITFGQNKVYVSGLIGNNPDFEGVPIISPSETDAFLWVLNGPDGSPYTFVPLPQDADTDSTNELQSLSLTNTQLSLSKSGSVDLSGFLENTDNQSLSLSTNTLSLTNEGSVDLSSYLDNTDIQTLSFNANQLSLTNGGSVDLSPLQDNLGTHIATQNLQLGPHFLSGDGGNEGISISADGHVGIGNNTPLHPLDFGSGVGRRIALAQNSLGTDFYGLAISTNTLEIHAASTPTEDPLMVLKNTR